VNRQSGHTYKFEVRPRQRRERWAILRALEFNLTAFQETASGEYTNTRGVDAFKRLTGAYGARSIRAAAAEGKVSFTGSRARSPRSPAPRGGHRRPQRGAAPREHETERRTEAAMVVYTATKHRATTSWS